MQLESKRVRHKEKYEAQKIGYKKKRKGNRVKEIEGKIGFGKSTLPKKKTKKKKKTRQTKI